MTFTLKIQKSNKDAWALLLFEFSIVLEGP